MAATNRNRERPSEPQSGGGGWEIVYSGFALILLCFFIMLASFSTMEKRKILSFVRSFAEAVSILPGGVGFEAGDVVAPDAKSVVKPGGGLEKLARELQQAAEAEGLADQVTLYPSGDGLGLRFSDTAVFALGEAELSAQARPLLARIGVVLKKTDMAIRIEGHTDDLPIRTARFPSNWELSTARAVRVLRYFIETQGFPSHRLSAAGFSRFHPLVPNDGPEGRTRNRRVEIVLTPAVSALHGHGQKGAS